MRIWRWLSRFILNFVWKITGGVIFALVWIVLGTILSLTIIGLPIGVKCYRIAYFAWKPFGHQVVVVTSDYLLLNILWGLTGGVLMCLISFIWFSALVISIVGIPLIFQWYKVMKASLFPFGVYIM